MTLWSWDPSVSPDVIGYVLVVGLGWIDYEAAPDEWGGFPTAHGAFTDQLETTSYERVDDMLPPPPLGMVWYVDVDAVDAANNRSPP